MHIDIRELDAVRELSVVEIEQVSGGYTYIPPRPPLPPPPPPPGTPLSNEPVGAAYH